MKYVSIIVGHRYDIETWSEIDGASICVISVEEYKALADGLIETSDLKPMLELGLRDYTFRSNNNG